MVKVDEILKAINDLQLEVKRLETKFESLITQVNTRINTTQQPIIIYPSLHQQPLPTYTTWDSSSTCGDGTEAIVPPQ